MSVFGVKTTSELIEAVKRRAFLPDAQETLTDDDILAFLNEEMYDSVLPLILQFHEEYLTYIETIPLMMNQNNYKIPYRAVGRKLRDVKYMDDQYNVYNMTRILPEDRAYFQETGFNPYKAFYFQGDELILAPGVGNEPRGQLHYIYWLRPNQLVLETRTAQITGIDLSTGIITLNAVPKNFTLGSNIDFIHYLPGNKLVNYDIPILAVDPVGLTVTVNPADLVEPWHQPDPLLINDYVCTAGESPVAQIPSELHSLLAERGCARCLASLGHTENLQNSEKKIQELELKSGSLIDNRSEGEPQKINNLNSILRASKISRRRFFF
jgi:hypothetical protein